MSTPGGPGLGAATLRDVTPATVVPAYDRSGITTGIVHFGVGGFHRAHQAVYLDTLLARDPRARVFGITGVSLLEQDRRIVATMTAQDYLYTVLVRAEDGSTQARVVGSVVGHLFAPDAPGTVLRLLADPAVRVVTLTITEGGYFHSPATDALDLEAPALLRDVDSPEAPATAFGYVVHALNTRRAAGTAPFTVLSCDNILGNGDVTRRVVRALADRIDPALAAWIAAEVAFPNSMVDRITPRTSPADVEEARALTGLDDGWPVTTEAFSQWVVEDRFPAGRPAWEDVGVELVDDVRPYEQMKLRLLNAAHQSIAYAGRLLGHEYGHEACADPTVARLMAVLQHREAARTLTPIPGTDFDEYADTVARRFADPRIRDALERLSTESSTSIDTFVLPIVRRLLDDGRDARAAIAVVACWARFLEGRDEQGRAYVVADRRAGDLTGRAARHDHDVLAVVRDNPQFRGLGDRDDFAVPYARILSAIRRDGVRAALDELLQNSG